LPSWLNSVHHDGSEKYVSLLYPQSGDTVRLRLRVANDAPVRRVILRTFPDGEQSLAFLERGAAEPPVQWWEGSLPIQEPVVHYRFLLEADDGIWHYTAAGPAAHIPLDNTDFQIIADYRPPDWLASAIFYQIFPDRFANGDPANDPQPDEYEYRGHRPQTFPWGWPPPADALFPFVFYGGDLQGITQRLDYLQALGVNALYLNPIFTAYSNHKYDVADYEAVDPHLGGNEALLALRQALDARGMRYLLDIVPNHCGYWHPWFQAARENPGALEAEFFTFRDHPDDYTSWLGVWSLPKLNYRSQELRRRMYEGPDAVFRRWLRPPYAADGWRVDVANMLGRQGATQLRDVLGQSIRQAVKETRPDAYLIGENFFDASAQLQGDQFDGVMNYSGLTLPLCYWLKEFYLDAHGFTESIHYSPWPTAAMAATWQSRRAAIPWAIGLQQYNILDSHDTPRIHTIVEGNDALHRLAAVVQFTYPGVPGLYYGDEIGLTDVPGLGPRACMPWNEARWDHSLLAFYRDLIALRRQSTILQRGGFQLLMLEEDTFAYQREGLDGRIIVVAHRAELPRPASALPIAHGGIPDEVRFVERFSGQEAAVANGSLPLPEHPQGATLWEEL
jgi:alpha-glucosidase